MKYFLALTLLFSSHVFAFENWNFSLIFGSANMTNEDGVNTYGSGLSLRSELFVEQNWGLLISAGSSQTQSDDLVGNNASEFEYNTNYGQAGGFLYFFDYFRVGAGLGLAKISETKRTSTETLKNDFSKMGPFYEVGFKYPFRPLVLGIDYIYQSYEDFNQKGFFFMIGFII